MSKPTSRVTPGPYLILDVSIVNAVSSDWVVIFMLLFTKSDALFKKCPAVPSQQPEQWVAVQLLRLFEKASLLAAMPPYPKDILCAITSEIPRNRPRTLYRNIPQENPQYLDLIAFRAYTALYWFNCASFGDLCLIGMK